MGGKVSGGERQAQLRVHQTWGAWRTPERGYKWQLDAGCGQTPRWRAEVVAMLA